MNDPATQDTSVIVLDIETLDTRPTAAIIAIAAVRIDPYEVNPVVHSFCAFIDPRSAMQYGTVDAGTLAWWMQQTDKVRAQWEGTTSLRDGLLNFSAWFPDENREVYGRGSDFDNTILAHAYRVLEIPMPWKFRNNRCLRTLTALAPSVPFVRAAVEHDALADAIAEAEHLVKLYKHYNLS